MVQSGPQLQEEGDCDGTCEVAQAYKSSIWEVQMGEEGSEVQSHL